MSNSMDLTATQMVWRPKFIRLTQIGNPDWDNGEPHPCYIDPAVISCVYRCVASFPKRDNPQEKHPDVECTAVFYCHGTLHVVESPEEVALMREKEYGHKSTLEAIK